jgi:hypothetical protein
MSTAAVEGARIYGVSLCETEEHQFYSTSAASHFTLLESWRKVTNGAILINRKKKKSFNIIYD